MILVPKAKPVKIRITSGGEEHSSLESLQKYFVWKDVSKLFDGRLEKWLKNINKHSEAQEIHYLFGEEGVTDFENVNISDIFKVYNILFPKDSISSINDTIISYEKNIISTSFFYEILLKENIRSLINLILYSDKKQRKSPIIPFLEINHFGFEKEFSPEELYEIGKTFYEEELSQVLSERLISLSINAGNKDAIDYWSTIKPIQQDKIKINNFDKIREIYKSKYTQNKIRESWHSFNFKMINNEKSKSPYKEIFEFSNDCLTIVKPDKYGNKDINKLVKNLFSDVSEEDILFEEQRFIRALFEPNRKVQKEILTSIDYYPPAKGLLDKNSITINNITFRRDTALNKSIIRDFVLNLDIFWEWQAK